MTLHDENRRSLWRTAATLALSVICAFAYGWAKANPEVALSLYTPVSAGVSRMLSLVFSLLPVSAAELMLYALGVLAAAYIVYTAVMLIIRADRLSRLFSVLSRFALAGSVLFFCLRRFGGLIILSRILPRGLD
jgi:hypothetical protein